MIWSFLNTGFKTGSFNMEFDLHLAHICKQGEAFLRLYRWEPYCISLGANQDVGSINTVKAAADNIDVVKRPTGGRAILHSEEITYSVIMPLENDPSARNIYNDINSAILAGLKIYDEKLADAELENIQPDFPEFYKGELSAVCFAASAKSEIKFTGKKLVGSAQRKMNNVILQHGSILCGNYHTKITDYLNSSSEAGIRIQNQMLSKTTDIGSILNTNVDYERLSECILSGFEEFYNRKFLKPDELPAISNFSFQS